MTTSSTATRPRVLFCGCAHYEIIPQEAREKIPAALSRAGLAVETVSDLCGLAARRDPWLQSWVQSPALAVVACFPRAVRWLFHAAGVPALDGQVRFFNMRTQTPEEIIAGISDCGFRIADSGSTVNPQSAIANPQSDWVPWFPVIDYDRCRNCRQCLNFCLFGVYVLSAQGRVEVQKPSGCKTNCPACARMCPRQAIIFPKYADPPINGAEIPVGAGFKPALTGDMYDRIRQRSTTHPRFAVGAQPSSGPAGSGQPQGVAPTGLCPTLESLRQELGIPPEVLKSLSPAEFGRLTEESKRKAAQKPQSDKNAGREKEDHE